MNGRIKIRVGIVSLIFATLIGIWLLLLQPGSIAVVKTDKVRLSAATSSPALTVETVSEMVSVDQAATKGMVKTPLAHRNLPSRALAPADDAKPSVVIRPVTSSSAPRPLLNGIASNPTASNPALLQQIARANANSAPDAGSTGLVQEGQRGSASEFVGPGGGGAVAVDGNTPSLDNYNIELEPGVPLPAVMMDIETHPSPLVQQAKDQIIADFEREVASAIPGAASGESVSFAYDQARTNADARYRALFGEKMYQDQKLKASIEALPDEIQIPVTDGD